MGEARRRGTFEERKAQAIAAGRIKPEHTRKVLFRKFDDVFKGPEPPEEKFRLVKELFFGGTPAGLAIRGIHRPIRQPGEGRKDHKPIATATEAS